MHPKLPDYPAKLLVCMFVHARNLVVTGVVNSGHGLCTAGKLGLEQNGHTGQQRSAQNVSHGALEEELKMPRIPRVPAGPLVISAGWGRTGTSSLKVRYCFLSICPYVSTRMWIWRGLWLYEERMPASLHINMINIRHLFLSRGHWCQMSSTVLGATILTCCTAPSIEHKIEDTVNCMCGHELVI